VRQDGCRGRRAAGWLPGRASLRVRLGATALCLLAGGTAIIAGACGLLARGYLMGQADQQLRSYAGRLVSRPFVASPLYGFTPGAQGAGGPGGGAVGIEVRGSAGQLVMRAAPRARPGQVIPPVPAAVAARAGQPVTVAAGNGGSWRVIAEPIHYRTWRIPFSYSAEGFAVLITSRARKGHVGTLVVGLDLDGINRAVRGLAIGALAVSGVVVLAVVCLGAVVTRAILRPVIRVEEALAAVAAGDLSCRVRHRHGGCDAGRLAWSVNTVLSQVERALGTRAESEAAAFRSRWRMCEIVAGTGHELRRPLSVIHGLAGAYRRGGRPPAAELDRMMRRVTDEAARMDALLDDLLHTPYDRPRT
jgi:two-component system, OmpR family, sensor kinase